MEGTYTVWLGKEAVGKVTVERQGLYYWFHCQCQLHSQVICRVNVTCGRKHESLGILVPSGEEYYLHKKLPTKLFISDIPEFWIAPRSPQKQALRIDIYPETPFRYIAKLERAFLEKNCERHVIVINE